MRLPLLDEEHHGQRPRHMLPVHHTVPQAPGPPSNITMEASPAITLDLTYMVSTQPRYQDSLSAFRATGLHSTTLTLKPKQRFPPDFPQSCGLGTLPFRSHRLPQAEAPRACTAISSTCTGLMSSSEVPSRWRQATMGHSEDMGAKSHPFTPEPGSLQDGISDQTAGSQAQCRRFGGGARRLGWVRPAGNSGAWAAAHSPGKGSRWVLRAVVAADPARRGCAGRPLGQFRPSPPVAVPRARSPFPDLLLGPRLQPQGLRAGPRTVKAPPPDRPRDPGPGRPDPAPQRRPATAQRKQGAARSLSAHCAEARAPPARGTHRNLGDIMVLGMWNVTSHLQPVCATDRLIQEAMPSLRSRLHKAFLPEAQSPGEPHSLPRVMPRNRGEFPLLSGSSWQSF
ncbi:PREDICTED: uncharacterized protein LOC105587619 [Cercocebus atys]|uniref:uncharacterized protein LOC105587619 n=1 Tax=Cercocebus atys TaxID=9531 RepID=UPI0005F51ADC|nr:PREDICTED: uncharacterized protein LOC105587619 [Cercocebus atys]